MYLAWSAESFNAARNLFTAAFRLCSKSTNVSSGQSFLCNSSRVTSSPGRSSSNSRMVNGWPSSRTLIPPLRNSRDAKLNSKTPKHTTFNLAGMATPVRRPPSGKYIRGSVWHGELVTSFHKLLVCQQLPVSPTYHPVGIDDATGLAHVGTFKNVWRSHDEPSCNSTSQEVENGSTSKIGKSAGSAQCSSGGHYSGTVQSERHAAVRAGECPLGAWD